MNFLLDLLFSTLNDTLVGYFSTVLLFPLNILAEIILSLFTPPG